MNVKTPYLMILPGAILLLSIFVTSSTFAYPLPGRVCSESPKSALYAHANELHRLLNDLERGINVQSVPRGLSYFTTGGIVENKRAIKKAAEALNLPFWTRESWEEYVERILGLGKFEGQAIVTAADNDYHCDAGLF